MSGCRVLLDESAGRYPDRPALTQGERTLTYADFDAAVGRLAARLGPLAPGQRVALVAPNCIAFPVALFAVWRAGGVPVPLNARYRGYELGRILRDAAVTAIVAVEAHRGYSFSAALAPLLPELASLRSCLFIDEQGAVGETVAGPATAEAPDLDPAVGAILYTSGTTGEPKGALVPHAREIVGAASVNAVLGAGVTDVAVLAPPSTHAFGLSCLLAMIAAGGHSILTDVSLSTAPLAGAVARHRATILHGTPALFASLLKLPLRDWPAPRVGLVAGAVCPPSIIERCDELGFRLLNLYGSTELGTVSCCRCEDPIEARATTVGQALPGYALRTVDGEVQVRGAHITPGYFRQPARTAAAFAGEWFRTGDLGALDAAGRLRITGRATEVIHVAGFNVFPPEVEGFLLTHPDVEQAVVVGVPHRTMGEVLQAFVVARQGATVAPPDLVRYARTRIAGYKLPYTIRVVPALPLLASGKPDRRALARQAAEEAGEQ